MAQARSNTGDGRRCRAWFEYVLLPVIDVAVSADAQAFDHEFRRALNGGSLPATPSMASDEAAYLDAVSRSFRHAGEQADAAESRCGT